MLSSRLMDFYEGRTEQIRGRTGSTQGSECCNLQAALNAPCQGKKHKEITPVHREMLTALEK